MNEKIIPVIVTPFTDKGEISTKGLEQLYSYLAEYRVKTMFVGGSYAAFAIMPLQMRIDLAFASTEVAHRYKLASIFNVGSSSPEETIKLIDKIKDSTVEYLATLVPYYYSGANFYNLNTIRKYLSIIVKASSLPVYLYNNPKTTSLDLSPSELQALSDTGIVGIKDSNESFSKLLEISKYPIAKPGNPVKYIPGTTASMLIAVSLGIEYCMSGIFISFPELISELFEHASRGEIRIALEIYKKCMKVREIMGSYVPRAVSAYYVLRHRGVDVGEPKFPWPRLDKKEQSILIEQLRSIGAL